MRGINRSVLSVGNFGSVLTRALPATEEPGNREPRIGNESSPHSSFSVLGFPVTRLPSLKVARTERIISQRDFASDHQLGSPTSLAEPAAV